MLTERALELCRLPAGSLVVDVGCGAGGTLQHLERSGLYRLVGLDRSETLLGAAGALLERVRLIQGGAETIPFGKETFDALFCECVLSILDDKSTAVDEFDRVLKDGAFLVISDIFRKGGHGRAGGARGAGGSDDLLSREALLHLLAERGFSILLWETHERLLKEFAVRMILAGERLPDLWRCGQREKEKMTARSAISYFLLVARKTGNAF